jgi:23S rRNA (uracil1939-C5)-methyltransferase
MLMNPGDIATLDIVSINSEGEGIARAGEDGFIVFVPGVLPGERVRCRVTRSGRNYAAAKPLDILESSPSRVAARCSCYGRCGGCQLQHATYEAQLRMKEIILADALKRIGRIDPPGGVTCLPSAEQWGYRNKTSLPVQQSDCGKSLVCGYYERRTHRAVPFAKCAVLRPSLENIVHLTIEAIAGAGFKGYNEAKKTGELRYIAARAGSVDGCDKVLTGVVSSRNLAPRELGRLRNLEQALGGKHRELVGSVLNIKTSPDNFIWGPVFKSLNGKKQVETQLEGYRFKLDISAFFQVNTAQAVAIFAYVKDCVEKSSSRELLELYSGAGGLTAYLASCAGAVDAVEEWKPSAERLKENMALNGMDNVSVYAGSVESFFRDKCVSGRKRYDAVVLDPPRTGCDENVVLGVADISPRMIVYVSCNPATLARDISRITPHGYFLESVAAFDMFPQTSHVESVAVLRKGTR